MKKIANTPPPTKLMNAYIAYLRAIYLTHQNNHWLTHGPNFYSDHKLFEKLYTSIVSDIDSAAEKAISLFGRESINVNEQGSLIQKLLAKYSHETIEDDGENRNKYILSSLKIEQDFLDFSKKLYNQLKETDVMTLGLDDMIMSIANKHESFIYLLKQSL